MSTNLLSIMCKLSPFEGSASSADFSTRDGWLRIFYRAGRGGLRWRFSGGHPLRRWHQGHLHGQEGLLRIGGEASGFLRILLTPQLLHGVCLQLHGWRKFNSNQASILWKVQLTWTLLRSWKSVLMQALPYKSWAFVPGISSHGRRRWNRTFCRPFCCPKCHCKVLVHPIVQVQKLA